MNPKWFNLIIITVIACISMVISYVVYGVLESSAEGTYAGFKLGGAIAVFIVVFTALTGAYQSFYKTKQNIDLKFVFGKNDPTPDYTKADCTINRLYPDGEEVTEKAMKIRPQTGGLTVTIYNAVPEEKVQIIIKEGNHTWSSIYESLNIRKFALNFE